MKNDFMTANEVIDYLGVGRAFVYRLLRKGEIPNIRIGRKVLIRENDLLTYLEKNTLRNDSVLKKDYVHEVQKPKKDKQLNLNVTADTLEKFKNLSKEKNMNYSDFFEEIVNVLE